MCSYIPPKIALLITYPCHNPRKSVLINGPVLPPWRGYVCIKQNSRQTSALKKKVVHLTALSSLIARYPWQQGSRGQHGAHLASTGPRWAPCWPHELCYMVKFSLWQLTVPSVTTQLSNWQPFVFSECVSLPRKTGLCPYYVVNDESVDVLSASGVRASGGMFCNLTDSQFFTHADALIN